MCGAICARILLSDIISLPRKPGIASIGLLIYLLTVFPYSPPASQPKTTTTTTTGCYLMAAGLPFQCSIINVIGRGGGSQSVWLLLRLISFPLSITGFRGFFLLGYNCELKVKKKYTKRGFRTKPLHYDCCLMEYPRSSLFSARGLWIFWSLWHLHLAFVGVPGDVRWRCLSMCGMIMRKSTSREADLKENFPMRIEL